MIRAATSEDFPSLVRIGHDFYEFNPYKEYVELDEESLVATLEVLLESHILLVMEEDEKVVGAAGAYVAPLYWNLNYVNALEVFWWIDPEYRTKGSGLALKQALETKVKESGVKFWSMVALESSEPEKIGKIYMASGFKPIEHTYMKVL